MCGRDLETRMVIAMLWWQSSWKPFKTINYIVIQQYQTECWNAALQIPQLLVSGAAVLDHEHLDHCSRTQSWSDHCTCKLWQVSIVCLDVSTTVYVSLNLKLLSLKLKTVLWEWQLFLWAPQNSLHKHETQLRIWEINNLRSHQCQGRQLWGTCKCNLL